jgi:uncharacterized protein
MRARAFVVVATLIAVIACSAPAAWSAQPGWSRQPNWPDSLLLATASPGGTYHAYGEGLSRILTRALGIRVAMRPTEGPIENIKLLEEGTVQLAFVTMGVALQAWDGDGEWAEGKEFRAMRAIFPMYDTPFQFAVFEESGIRSIADMAGKRIGVGPEGGTTGTYLPRFLETLGIDADLSHGDWDDLAARMQERELDVLAVAAGVPFPSFAELEAKNTVRYVPLTRDQIVALDLAMPELTPSVVPVGVYPSLNRRYETVGLFNFAVAHKDLPADLVYRIVEAVFANREQLMEAHPAAVETIPANFSRNTFLPFHAGASRYYQNIGAVGIVLAD